MPLMNHRERKEESKGNASADAALAPVHAACFRAADKSVEIAAELGVKL